MRNRVRIGALLPNSTYIRRLASDIRQAAFAVLKSDPALELDVVVESTSYNESPGEVRGKLRDLMISSDVDVVLAPLNTGMVPRIADLAEGQGTPVIVLTLGEDIFAGDVAPPWIFLLSMGYWRSAWLAGYRAASAGGDVCILSCAHAGGYGMSFAAALGVEAAGGKVAATIPAPAGIDALQASDLVSYTLSGAPGGIVFLGAGPDGEALGGVLAGAADRPAIWGLPPVGLLPGPIRSEVNAAVHCFSAWNPCSDASSQFIEEWTASTSRAVHPYAVLAREAGLFLAEAVGRLGSAGDRDALRSALADSAVTGPRGPVAFDPATQEAVTPQVCLTFTLAPDGRSIACAEPVRVPDLLDEQVALARQNIDKQGWTNPFLVA